MICIGLRGEKSDRVERHHELHASIRGYELSGEDAIRGIEVKNKQRVHWVLIVGQYKPGDSPLFSVAFSNPGGDGISCEYRNHVNIMSKKVAIVQSNYIPWKGYFDLINLVDEFILYDDVQYTRQDWRNRNRIKTPDGLMWLTIPVKAKGRHFQKVRETVISDPGWSDRHWQSIIHSYSRAEYFHTYRELFEALYLGHNERFLSQVNYRFLSAICQILGINTKLSWSMDYHLIEGDKTERLVDLCQQAGATEYISGPAAKAYINEELFEDEGILLRYMDYSGYPEYHQLFPPFEHSVSIIDLIFNEGPNAPRYMRSF